MTLLLVWGAAGAWAGGQEPVLAYTLTGQPVYVLRNHAVPFAPSQTSPFVHNHQTHPLAHSHLNALAGQAQAPHSGVNSTPYNQLGVSFGHGGPSVSSQALVPTPLPVQGLPKRNMKGKGKALTPGASGFSRPSSTRRLALLNNATKRHNMPTPPGSQPSSGTSSPSSPFWTWPSPINRAVDNSFDAAFPSPPNSTLHSPAEGFPRWGIAYGNGLPTPITPDLVPAFEGSNAQPAGTMKRKTRGKETRHRYVVIPVTIRSEISGVTIGTWKFIRSARTSCARMHSSVENRFSAGRTPYGDITTTQKIIVVAERWRNASDGTAWHSILAPKNGTTKNMY